MKKLILFEAILIIFFVLAWNVSKADDLENCSKMLGIKCEHAEEDVNFDIDLHLCPKILDSINFSGNVYVKYSEQNKKNAENFIYNEKSIEVVEFHRKQLFELSTIYKNLCD